MEWLAEHSSHLLCRARKKRDAMSRIGKSLWSEDARLPLCWNCTVVAGSLPEWRRLTPSCFFAALKSTRTRIKKGS